MGSDATLSNEPEKRYSVLNVIIFGLRTVIGWHFLYEGVTILTSPEWTAAGYLSVSKWIFSDLFQWIANNATALSIVNFMNEWGLILVGSGLILGFFPRIASIGGMGLLLLYYIANPPFIGMDFGMNPEGNYLVIDKNMVELFALAVIVVYPGSGRWGVSRLFTGWYAKVRADKHQEERNAAAPENINRRDILKNLAGLPVMGAFVLAVLKKNGWESYEEKFLADYDAVSAATAKTYHFLKLKDLTAVVPKANIKGVEISRLILGGNLIGGWAHARDLIYVSKFVKAYHTDEKVFETLWLAEKCGVNTILTSPMLCRVINEYWRRNIGKIQFISDCGGRDLLENVQFSIDNGASACYVQGAIADNLVKNGQFGLIHASLELIRQNGLPAGIGAHSLQTVKQCVERGLQPDFWMKTLHHCDYWSAQIEQEHDNIWCTDPEDTIAFMEQLEQPWIAFKILAAGAIEPDVGFRYALEGGADFLCVGMYDFQLVDDVNTFTAVYSTNMDRRRPWRA